MSTLGPVSSYHSLVRKDVFPALPNYLGRILDLGGGIGATSAELKRAGRATYVVVADQVAGQLEEVDKAYVGDLEDEKFLSNVIAASGPFDTILALDVLEHLRDPWRIAGQLRDGLARDGELIASLPNVNYHRLVMPLVLRGRYELTDSGILDRTHLRWFTKHSALELMTTAGLEVQEVRPNIFGRRERFLDKITFRILTRFLALQYVIRSKRTT